MPFVTHYGPLSFLPDYIVFNPGSANEYTVFHELIHAYLHYKRGVDNGYKSIQEGIAWSAEQMLINLDVRMSKVEDELENPKPNIGNLKSYWNTAWMGIAGYTSFNPDATNGTIIGRDLSVYNRGPTNKCDVMRVKSKLGFSISCAPLAKKYTEIIRAKPKYSCYKFICDVSDHSTHISLYEPLIQDIFR